MSHSCQTTSLITYCFWWMEQFQRHFFDEPQKLSNTYYQEKIIVWTWQKAEAFWKTKIFSKITRLAEKKQGEPA